MSYQVIARKYRPQRFDEIVGEEHITRTIQNAIEAGRLHHAYLFAGVRGVGKTTLARILAKALNCEKGPAKEPCNACAICKDITATTSLDVQEIDGASNTGVDDVREIRERIKYLPNLCRYKVYIIDEVHMLSTSAFNALLKTLEPPAHVIFIFATTEPHKIPATILSRCQRYDFKRINIADISKSLGDIAKREGVTVDAGALNMIAHEAEGSMRDGQSLFDQAIAFAGNTLTQEKVAALLGLLDRAKIRELGEAVVGKDATRALSILEEIYQTGGDLQRVSLDLLSFFRNLLVAKGGGTAILTDITADDVKFIKDISERTTLEECEQWFSILFRGAEDIARTKFQKMVFEYVLIRLVSIKPVANIDELLERLEAVKNAVPKAGTAVPAVEARPSTPVTSPAPTKAPTQPAQGSAASYKTGDDLLKWLAVNKPQLASILSHGKLIKLGSQLEVTFPKGSLYGDMLLDADRKKSTEEAARQFFGSDVSIVVKTDENGGSSSVLADRHQVHKERAVKEKQAREEALKHDFVKEVTNIFGAEIQEIKTSDLSNGRK